VATRSKPTGGRAGFVVLVAVTSALAGGCAGGGNDGSVAGTATTAQRRGPAWTAATAQRRIGGSTVNAAGRQVKIDPTTVVCWGTGRSERRASARVWSRFDCIAPTFRGAEAGPDLLFVLEPTGATTFRVRNTRFSSYGGG
jgi:hypothetical protein